MLTRTLCLFALCTNSCFGTNRYPVCRQLQDVVNNLCAESDENSGRVSTSMSSVPGKRGPAGNPGRNGSPGAVGPPGKVDYERIDAEINGKFQQAFEKRDAEISQLMLKIAILDGKVRLLENREGACEIKYDNKCFWVETLDYEISYDVGVSLCTVRGGAPANIYSEQHYDIIMRYLRIKMLQGRNNVHAWIGMRTNPLTGAASYSDGTAATIAKWYPGYPKSLASYTHMGIVQRNPSTQDNIGIYNWPTTHTRDAVLCEI